MDSRTNALLERIYHSMTGQQLESAVHDEDEFAMIDREYKKYTPQQLDAMIARKPNVVGKLSKYPHPNPGEGSHRMLSARVRSKEAKEATDRLNDMESQAKQAGDNLPRGFMERLKAAKETTQRHHSIAAMHAEGATKDLHVDSPEYKEMHDLMKHHKGYLKEKGWPTEAPGVHTKNLKTLIKGITKRPKA